MCLFGLGEFDSRPDRLHHSSENIGLVWLYVIQSSIRQVVQFVLDAFVDVDLL